MDEVQERYLIRLTVLFLTGLIIPIFYLLILATMFSGYMGSEMFILPAILGGGLLIGTCYIHAVCYMPPKPSLLVAVSSPFIFYYAQGFAFNIGIDIESWDSGLVIGSMAVAWLILFAAEKGYRNYGWVGLLAATVANIFILYKYTNANYITEENNNITIFGFLFSALAWANLYSAVYFIQNIKVIYRKGVIIITMIVIVAANFLVANITYKAKPEISYFQQIQSIETVFFVKEQSKFIPINYTSEGKSYILKNLKRLKPVKSKSLDEKKGNLRFDIDYKKYGRENLASQQMSISVFLEEKVLRLDNIESGTIPSSNNYYQIDDTLMKELEQLDKEYKLK